MLVYDFSTEIANMHSVIPGLINKEHADIPKGVPEKIHIEFT